jgi:hypothetical protein
MSPGAVDSLTRCLLPPFFCLWKLHALKKFWLYDFENYIHPFIVLVGGMVDG